MDIKEIRQKYPQYEDMSDEQLAGALHRKFYSDMPQAEFMASIGLAPKAAQPFWDRVKQAARPEPFNEGLIVGGVRGVKDVVDFGAQAAANLAGDGESVRAANQAGRADFEQQYGGSVGAGIGRLLGNVAGTGPVVRGIGLAVGQAPRLAGLGEAISTFGASGGGLGTRVAGGAISGGVSSGIVEPKSAPAGAAIGAAIPVVGAGMSQVGRAAAKVVKPMTKNGRAELVAQIIRESAQDPSAVVSRLAAPPRAVAPLTFAEVANDPGISSLQRSLVNESKQFSDDLALMHAQQNTARFQSLYGMSGGDSGITAVKAARASVADPLLNAALGNAGSVGTMGVRSAAKQISTSPSFQRKAVRSAVQEAVSPFAIVDDGAKAWARQVPFEKAWGARQNIDDILNGASNKVNEKAAQAAASQLGLLRKRLSTALNRASPDFAQFSKVYAKESKKVEAAETLYDLVKKASTGTRDINGNPVVSGAMLDRALKNIEPRKWAAMTDVQRAQVGQLVDELTTAARVQTLGKAVGSNTAQNLRQPESLPFALRAVSGLAPTGTGIFSAALDAMLRNSQTKVQGLLGQAMLNPAVAAQAFVPPAPALTPMYQQLIGGGARRALPLAPAGLIASQN